MPGALIKVTEVVGKGEPDSGMEHVLLERGEMQKRRIRRNTDRGTDVGMELPDGTTLRHGDLVRGDGLTVMVLQTPERVGVVRPAGGRIPTEAWMLAAHAIGNMHRPVSVGPDHMAFPVQEAAERETFSTMLERLGAGLFEVTMERAVFEPHAAADVAGHG